MSHHSFISFPPNISVCGRLFLHLFFSSLPLHALISSSSHRFHSLFAIISHLQSLWTLFRSTLWPQAAPFLSFSWSPTLFRSSVPYPSFSRRPFVPASPSSTPDLRSLRPNGHRYTVGLPRSQSVLRFGLRASDACRPAGGSNSCQLQPLLLTIATYLTNKLPPLYLPSMSHEKKSRDVMWMFG
jgi:hypothetical protein